MNNFGILLSSFYFDNGDISIEEDKIAEIVKL